LISFSNQINCLLVPETKNSPQLSPQCTIV